MVRPPFYSEVVELEANAKKRIKLSFEPDSWIIAPRRYIHGEVEVRLGVAVDLTPFPISGIQPLTLSGLGEDRLLLESKTDEPTKLLVIASRGITAANIVPPPERFFDSQEVTIGAGTSVTHDVSFYPDQWKVIPASPIFEEVKVYPDPNLSDTLSMIGEGVVEVPGQGTDDIKIENTGAYSVTVKVVASQSYAPSVTLPSVARQFNKRKITEVHLAQAINLVENPSFETDTAGWVDMGGGVLSRTEADAFFGAYTGSHKSSAGWGYSRAQRVISIVASTTYAFSVRVKAGTPAAVGKTFVLSMIGDSSGETITGNFTLTNSWQLFNLAKTMDGSDTTLTIAIVWINDTSEETFYFDAVKVEVGPLTPYFDGSLGPGRAWSGTPHASTSIREPIYKYTPGFQPDLWKVWGEDNLINGIAVSKIPDFHGEEFRILGTGAASIPGKGESTIYALRDAADASIDINGVASYGLPFADLIQPLSSATPRTISPKAINVYHAPSALNVHSFEISHPGGPLLILASSSTHTIGSWYTITSVSAAGWGLTELVEAQTPSAGSYGQQAGCWFRALDLPSGNITVEIQIRAADTAWVTAYCVSLDEGIAPGGVGSFMSQVAGSENLDVNVQTQGVWTIYSVVAARGAAGDTTENTSAIKLDEFHTSAGGGGSNQLTHKKIGTAEGLVRNTYTVASDRAAGAAVELYIT